MNETNDAPISEGARSRLDRNAVPGRAGRESCLPNTRTLNYEERHYDKGAHRAAVIAELRRRGGEY